MPRSYESECSFQTDSVAPCLPAVPYGTLPILHQIPLILFFNLSLKVHIPLQLLVCLLIFRADLSPLVMPVPSI